MVSMFLVKGLGLRINFCVWTVKYIVSNNEKDKGIDFDSKSLVILGGTAVAQGLRCCATNR